MPPADPTASEASEADSRDELAGALRHRMERLFPLCRSISGPGLRATLDLIGDELDLDRSTIPTGTEVFDWTIGDEWSIRAGYVETMSGERVVDFTDHNLHVVGYSAPVDAVVSLEELQQHLHSLPDHPDWIPYRTSYYSRSWGFCLTDRVRAGLRDERYHVVIDSTLEPGGLDYGELLIPGESSDEVLISAHVCHPSLVNDNLAGITVAVQLARYLDSLPRRRLSYRFVFAPGTIGSLAWLSRNPEAPSRVRHGLVLTGLGGPGPLTYKETRDSATTIDRAARYVVRRASGDVRPYSPWGYDERQYNAVGFGMPVGRLSRTPHGEYPQYHTSADDLDFVTDERLVEAYEAVVDMIMILETDRVLTNLVPYGEPQLGKRGLYPSMGGKAASDFVLGMLWVLAYSDGKHSLFDIAQITERAAGPSYAQLREAAEHLERAGLVDDAKPAPD